MELGLTEELELLEGSSQGRAEGRAWRRELRAWAHH